jgi:hypothetical protein
MLFHPNTGALDSEIMAGNLNQAADVYQPRVDK